MTSKVPINQDRLINGDEKEFKSLFDLLYVGMVQQATFYTNDFAVAEDVVQEIFVRLWEKRGELKSVQNLEGYLLLSVKNRCLNYLKHEEVERRHAEILLQEQNEEDEDYRLMREELYRELHRTVDELPKRCRQVFELHLQGKKNEEIAQVLELSVETVKTQKKKAMYFLRERLGKSYYLLIILNIIDL